MVIRRIEMMPLMPRQSNAILDDQDDLQNIGGISFVDLPIVSQHPQMLSTMLRARAEKAMLRRIINRLTEAARKRTKTRCA